MMNRRGVEKRKNAERRGFTLVELLIVTSILSIVTVAALGLATTMQTRARDIHEHSHQASMIGRTLDQWRADIELAERIEPEAKDGCTLTLAGGTGAERVIRYAMSDDRLERLEGNGSMTLVAEHVKRAEITSEGGAWRLGITTTSGEGVERIERTFQAWASPIHATPAKEARP